ncbi:restriction endonuclease subunit S [Vibrio parahaemolyticus]|uniref:restriction endonuclease subunit S n=1 Tax=Vibrio parahaemolyticus TaxID=670 RepID=UPI00215D4525|nr:restriction endonuclease subunit S [Vibrio parahaemolyticus]MCR9696707.1 restriction endonuclease subunit S [Vibrio parahaemolyticus]MCR9762280.1 restriction endonuclease subunit S [Vibrio parahaemolyticus]
MSWPLVSIGSVAKIASGYAFKSKDFEEIGSPIVRISNVKNGSVDLTKVARIPEEKLNKGKRFQIESGSLLIAMSGATTGKVGRYVPINDEPAYLNQRVGKFVCNEELLDLNYLWFFTQSSTCQKQISFLAAGAAQPNISSSQIESIEIPLPPLETQKQIAAVLGKADQLRKDCQQMEQELNSLAQSVFIDMFGDPVTNPKGWEVRAIGTTFDLLTDYHANGSYEVLQENVTLLNEGYALMVRTTDLEKNNFTDGVNYISEHAYEFLTKTKVFGNELIVNKIGSAGKVYLMPVLNRPVSLAMNQFMIRFNEELASSVFMYYLLTSKGGTQAIQKKVKGAVTKTIRKDALREIALPIPPKVKQDEFSQFIEQHKKLLDDNKLLKDEYEQSFNALMQKAFKGELDL